MNFTSAIGTMSMLDPGKFFKKRQGFIVHRQVFVRALLRHFVNHKDVENWKERDLLCVSGVRMVFCKVMSSKRLNGWL